MELFKITSLNETSLYIATKPQSGTSMQGDIENLKKLGKQIIMCSLLTNNEIKNYQLEEEPQFCKLNTIEFMHLEITDESIPTYLSFLNFVEAVINKIECSDTLIIHCKHGIGRSGMMAAAILLNFGYTLENACKLISNARGYQVPQSTSQRKILGYYYENEIKK